QERVVKGFGGWVMVVVLLVVLGGAVTTLVNSAAVDAWVRAAAIIAIVLDTAAWAGLTVVNPNTAKVLLLFGDYKGSIKTPGFWWVNPLTMRRTVSLRTRNFESGKLKVNDHIGNPIEIAAIVVWRVVETAEAL